MMHYMDVSAESLAHVIGSRIKQERSNRRWTLDQLAEVAAVSRRMLVKVEQGAVNPSVGTLLRLSDALGIGLPALVEPPTPRTVKLVRSGEGARLWSGDHGGAGVLVAGTQPPDVVELWDWTLNPGDHHASEAHTSGTRELLHVQTGSILVTVGDDAYELRTGDALTFYGDVAHSYDNPGQEPVRFSLTVFEPGVGAVRGTEPSND
ncbi:hypothetical protein HMPREF0975_01840 [Actinomyces sp. oral taxon 849 str. F0330]|nr:hypothetical protein HMPREF0975_01840 [Actinomyces sp. oral taxon 849 str. F0330]